MDLKKLAKTPAAQLNSLVPRGKYQGVVAEVFFHLGEQDILEDKKPTGVKEIVGQMVVCFEIVLGDGSRRVVDTKSLNVMYANGNPASIHSVNSNIHKFLSTWAGGRKGNDLDAWLGDYMSLEGRQVILNVNHVEKNGSKYQEIGSVMEVEPVPGQPPPPVIKLSKDYVPFAERNKEFLKLQDDGNYLRVYGKKDEEEGHQTPPAETSSESRNRRAEESRAAVDAQAPPKKKVPF